MLPPSQFKPCVFHLPDLLVAALGVMAEAAGCDRSKIVRALIMRGELVTEPARRIMHRLDARKERAASRGPAPRKVPTRAIGVGLYPAEVAALHALRFRFGGPRGVTATRTLCFLVATAMMSSPKTLKKLYRHHPKLFNV